MYAMIEVPGRKTNTHVQSETSYNFQPKNVVYTYVYTYVVILVNEFCFWLYL